MNTGWCFMNTFLRSLHSHSRSCFDNSFRCILNVEFATSWLSQGLIYLMSVLQRQSPQRYKITVVTWFGVFPTITLLLYLLGPLLDHLPLVIRTLVLSAIMVPLLTYVVMPWLTKLLHRWLFAQGRRSSWLVLMFAIERYLKRINQVQENEVSFVNVLLQYLHELMTCPLVIASLPMLNLFWG